MRYLALVFLLSAPPCAWAKGEAYKLYLSSQTKFSCEIPSSWSLGPESEVGEKEKVFSLFLQGGRSKDGIMAKLSVDYYAPGNALFRGPKDYLERNTDDSIHLHGEKIGPVSATTIGGLKAKRFVRNSIEFPRPRDVDPKEVPITEEIVVIEGKTGFWVAALSTAAGDYRANRLALERLLRTFRPLP